jgi:hypothetical protein
MRPLRISGTAVAAVLTIAAGCGGHSDSSATSSAVRVNPSEVPAFHADRNARAAVTVHACRIEPSGSWSMSGSIVNRHAVPAGYTLVVDFVTIPGSTVVDTSVIRVRDIQPGRIARWSTSGGGGNRRLACVLRYAQSG